MAAVPPVCGQVEPLDRYYLGLRDRHLFPVAEADILRRLGDEQLPPAYRAELSIELSRTYAAHASHSRGAERDELWRRAAAVLDELLERDRDSAERVLLLAQRGQVPADLGMQLRWRVDLFPLNDAIRARAIAVLEDARSRLAEAHRELEQALSEVTRRPIGQRSSEAGLLPHQLKSLARSTEFQLALTQLDLAKVLPSGPDRTDMLAQAAKRFNDLTTIARPDEIAWNSRIALIEIVRLQQQPDLIPPRVTSVLSAEPPPAIRDRAVAELVRGQLEQREPATALATLQQHQQTYGSRSDELNALLVEALLLARSIAREHGDEELAADLMQQAESTLPRLAGGWAVRGRLLITRAREEDKFGPELADALDRAKWAKQNGDLTSAIEWQHRALVLARIQNRPDLEAEFAMTAAGALVEAGRFDEAVTLLEPLSRSADIDTRAAQADLLRAYALGRLYEQQPTTARRDAYRAALEDHCVRFAQQSTLLEATWMLALLEEHAQEWTRALSLYGEIPATHARGPAAQARVADLYDRILNSLHSQGQPVGDWQARAIDQLQAYVRDFPPAPARVSIEQSRIALKLARWLLDQSPPDFAAAGTLLDRVLDTSRIVERETKRDNAPPDPVWNELSTSASQLRVVTLAGEGHLEQARQALAELAQTAPVQMLDVLHGLTEVSGSIGVQHRQALARMQLELSQHLDARRDQLDVALQGKLDECLAEARAATGDIKGAAVIYEKLLWQQPDDRRMLTALARLYDRCTTAECRRSALEVWTRLEKFSARDSGLDRSAL